MTEEYFTRMGDGRRVYMTRQQIMDEIHEGMSEGADAARIPSLTDDEMEAICDVICMKTRIVGVEPGEEAIISNDGWWGDTPGYKHLFSISRLRAIEHRRAIARSANTGKSGFISARGEVGETLGWEERGILTTDVPLNSEMTFYTQYGDYLARIAEYVLLLSLLYFVAYRVKRRNHLVK